MRLLAIGDVHGNNRMLRKLLERIDLHEDDQLVMLGDYIDRGPESRGVVETLLELKGGYPQTVFLRGNHEQMLLDALFELGFLEDWTPLRSYSGSPDLPAGMDRVLFEMNGGLATLESYRRVFSGPIGFRGAAYRALPQQHVDFLRRTVFYYLQGDYMFVHAGINEQDPLGEKGGPYEHLWQRNSGLFRIGRRDLTLVHGHTPCLVPLLNDRELNLDTGAGYGRALTGCNVMTREVWQVFPEEVC